MNKDKQSSLKFNMLLNSIRGVMGILFPLITFPYVSRVLAAENIGKYNFANSVISYFILFSALGIYSYSVREGARFRNDRERLKKFGDEVFSINVFSTVVAYVLLIITILLVSKLQNYLVLLFVLSFQIVFKTISIEWIYSIYEDYLYITIRSILIQIISLILMFVFVRNASSLVAYTIIVTLSTGGSSIFNFKYAKRYFRPSLIRNLNLRYHLKPIMLIFATSIAVSIYVSSDITILGFMCNDTVVGIYSVSVKIYTIIKTVLISILAVTIPRLAYHIGDNNHAEFVKTVKVLLFTLCSIAAPCVVGIIALSDEIVLLVAGNKYTSASSSLRLLGVALMFCLLSWCWGQCVLITMKMEKVLFVSTLISAIVNVILNIILIPYMAENAAALSTIIAELICMVINWAYGRRFAKIDGLFWLLGKVAMGCVGIFASVKILRLLAWDNYIVFMIVSIITSVIVYFGIEILIRNDILKSFACLGINKFKKIKSV